MTAIKSAPRKTSRELTRFFVHIKPGKIIADRRRAWASCWGIVTRQLGHRGIALAIGGLFAPKLILKIWRDIRASQVEAQLMDALDPDRQFS